MRYSVKRSTVLDKITPFIDNELIKVVTGIRRSGKTVVLDQIIQILVERGVDSSQIIKINFESFRFEKITDAELLYDFVKEKIEKSFNQQKIYIFLDEIQNVSQWEKAVNSFRVDFDCDIYITGSNSKLLSGELATHLAGRYVSFELLPFSFKEAKEFSVLKGSFTSDEALFSDYIEFGGFPQRFQFQDMDSIRNFLTDLYNSVVLKDIVERNKINSVKLLQSLCFFIMDNIGNPFSANSISNKLKSEKISLSTDSVLNYLEYIQNAFIVYGVKRYDLVGKKILESKEKYYAADLGLRNVVKCNEKIDVGQIYENLVFLELKNRGWNVLVGKDVDKEIDFIAIRGKEKIYVQVAYLINENDMEREFGNLEKIKDNYPKYVISSDLVDLSRNGVIHKNIIRWLLE